MSKEAEQFNIEFEALAEKFGVVDYFLCGVTVDSETIANINVGLPGPSSSNRERGLFMVGLVHENLFDYLQTSNELRRNGEDEASLDD